MPAVCQGVRAVPVPAQTRRIRPMSKQVTELHRRGFLQTAGSAAGAALAPMFIPGSVLGKNGAVPPSERIVMGGHWHRQSGHLRPRLLPGAEGRPVRRRLRRQGSPPHRRQEADRRARRQSELRNVSRLSRAA